MQPELELFWRLSLQRPVNPKGRALSDAFNAFADVEALLWVHYGVEVGIFTDKDVGMVLRSECHRLHRALALAQGTRLWPCFAPRIRSFLESTSAALLPNNDSSLDKVVGTRYVDQSFRTLLNPLVMEMLFHAVAHANTNPVYCLFSDLITFAEESEWQNLLMAGVEATEILSNSGSEASLLCSGYFASLDHLGAVRELADYGADESRGDYPTPRESQADHTFLNLTDRIRSMRLWRLDLNDRRTKERFMRLTYKIHEALAADEELRSIDFEPRIFLDRVEALCADWLGKDSVSFPRDLAA